MRYILALFLLACSVSFAQAQAPTRLCYSAIPGDTRNCIPVDTGWPLPVTASVSVGGFAPGLAFATLTASGTSDSVALPTGASVQFQNTGTTAVSCTLGIGSATAIANEIIIQPSSTKVLVVGTNTFGACIDQSGSASNLVVLNGGAGLGTDSGGGGSGSSSGGTVAVGLPVFTTWSSATAGNATQIVYCAPAVSAAYQQGIVQLDQTSTISGGAVTFEGSNDTTTSNCSDGNWVPVPVAQIIGQGTFQPLTNAYTLVQSTNQPFLIGINGYRGIRIRLSTTITGSGTVTPFGALFPTVITDLALQNPLAAGSAIVGKLGIDQTTPGTTNNVTVSPLPRAARNTPGCTVGTSSAQCLAAATAVNFLQLQNVNATSTNNIACNIVGGTAVLNSATSIQLAPGQSASWGPNTGGVPSGAINCIGTSASSPLYVEWN